MRKLCVIGSGYVGLVTGTCFADMGNDVTLVDIDERKIEMLLAGQMPIYEPGLAEMVQRNTDAGRMHFTTSYAEGLATAEFVFICVGTPSGVDGEADLQYVRAAAQTIAETMDHPLIVINKSTVPVGTGDWTTEIISSNQPQPVEFAVVSCPEFLREGSAIADFMQPDRTVLGSTDLEAADTVAELYAPLDAPIVITDLRTAEMIKYASNAFLATRISFINEISIILNVSAPMSPKWRAAWVLTSGSARIFCKPASASAVPVSPRMSKRWPTWRRRMACIRNCSTQSWR